jgi:hypothetical protein
MFMKLYTVVVHNLQMCMKEYRCCLKFRRGDNSTYTFTKRGVVYLVSATPPRRLFWSFVKLYTVVVHYLQMCMKEYGCCPKFKRGDNSTYTFTKRGFKLWNFRQQRFTFMHICRLCTTTVQSFIKIQ